MFNPKRFSQSARRLLVLSTLTVMASLFAKPGTAQVQIIVNPDNLSTAEVLQRFEEEARASPRVSEHRLMVRRMLSADPREAGQTEVDALISGLERLAIDSDDPRVASPAAGLLAVAGLPYAHRPRPDVPERLLHIWENAENVYAQRAVISRLPYLADRETAIEILSRITMQPTEEHPYDGAGGSAALGLAFMGEDGRAALRSLHQSGRIPDGTRQAVERMAERGYRAPGNHERPRP